MAEFDKYTEYVDFPCHYERLQWIFDTIKDANLKPVKILDVGCGTGNVTLPLCILPNAEVTGIDVHQGNLDITASRNKFDNLTLKFQYFEKGEIKDFDYIILTEVLEHIPNYTEILEYAAKNGKKGMQLLITVPNGYGPFEIGMQPLYLMRKMGLNGFIWKVKKLLGKKEPYSQNYDTPHVNFFTVSRLRRELKDMGMQIVEVKNAYFLAPVFETYLPFIPLKSFAKFDNWLASKLPHFMASGHYYRIMHI
jgi:2-polyprenyl-3-methyl-5-hydroxy-6-metoxy-1,4-benzoquinol methylase